METICLLHDELLRLHTDAALQVIDITPRLLGAPELVGLFDDVPAEAEIVAAEPEPASVEPA